MVELAQRLNVAKGRALQSVPIPQPAVTVSSTLAGSNVKLEAPETFNGNVQKLSNFVFSVCTNAKFLGISDATEQVKLAIILLIGCALTWWRSVSQDSWAILGYCNWALFETKVGEQFHDLHHVMRMQHELARLSQIASVQAYNYAFQNVYMEIRNEMSNADALFAYVNGFKEAVQIQVMLHDPADLLQAMSLADRIDSTMQFASSYQGPRQPGHQPPPPHPSPYQGIRTGYLRPGAGGGLSNPVPINLGAVDSAQPRGFRNISMGKYYICGNMRHFARQCMVPRQLFNQQGQASVMVEIATYSYQPYFALRPPPLPPCDVQPAQHELPKMSEGAGIVGVQARGTYEGQEQLQRIRSRRGDIRRAHTTKPRWFTY